MNFTNKLTVVALTSTLSILTLPIVSLAESEINKIEEKKVTIQKRTKESKKKIDELKKKQEQILNDLDDIDKIINNTNKKIEEKDKQIKGTRSEIVTLKKQTNGIQKRIDQRKEILDERMRSLQKSGGNISYIDIIFGSNSFSDLVQRINAVGTIIQADKDIMQAQHDDLEMVEKKKEDIQFNEEKLEKDVLRLKEINQDLSKKVKEKNKLVSSLKQEQHDEEEDVLNLEEQEKLLEEQEKAMKATKNKPRYSNGTSVANSVNLPAVSSGNFTRPADGYVSSGYGYRSFDNELHAGIDIVKKGTVPVVSAADGVVIRAYKSSSYGNVVFVSHNIDGKVFTTVYAHMNSFNVSSGQTVSKGQQVGYMGNTGQSFGQHLHFELHAGSWNQSKSNAVDPEKYINF